MKVSYKWLNEYFEKKLPPAEKAAEILTMNSCEVDGIEKTDGDQILDVKILPNMAHHCLCHRGLAQEFSALLDRPIKKYSRELKPNKESGISLIRLDIKVENPKDCRRYVGRVIEGVKIGPSPTWLKTRLENLGQRSINNLVDATNFVMLELGQPMHVFDADKITGSIIEIKRAKNGTQMRTLDGKTVELDDSILVIANQEKLLAIAGIKGGVQAEISAETKNIILESANFDPVLVRKTAQKIKIQTEASKRYENDLTPELCGEAMDLLTKLILEIGSTAEVKVGRVVGIYPEPARPNKPRVAVSEVEKLLGLKISRVEIADIFRRLNFAFENKNGIFTVTPPVERLDIKLKEDLIEEILKIYGYDKIRDNKRLVKSHDVKINQNFYYANKIREILVNEGFSEIYGYTFAEKGEIELANSVAPEKKWLRNNLTDGLRSYLEFNAHYVELISMPQIKIFEIGKVFGRSAEQTNLVIGVKNPSGLKLIKEEVIIKNITDKLGLALGLGDLEGVLNQDKNIVEFNLANIITKLAEPKADDIKLPLAPADMRFKKISIYPFAVRDVAVFTPEGTTEKEVLELIRREAGDLLMKDHLFDIFTKKLPDGSTKTSFAFRLVLQSYDHTLSEEEITGVMGRITAKLNTQKDWQVR